MKSKRLGYVLLQMKTNVSEVHAKTEEPVLIELATTSARVQVVILEEIAVEVY